MSNFRVNYKKEGRLVPYKSFRQLQVSWRGRPRKYCLTFSSWNQLKGDAV